MKLSTLGLSGLIEGRFKTLILLDDPLALTSESIGYLRYTFLC